MKEPLSIKYRDKVASPLIRSSDYFERHFNLREGALRRNQSSLVVLRDSDKAEIPLLPSDHVVGAFGKEIGFMRSSGGLWWWLDRPDLGKDSRPIMTDRRVKEMIDSGHLQEIPLFSIKKRESVSQIKRLSILNRDRFLCKYCGSPVDEVTGAVDHFIPVAFGRISEDANSGGRFTRVVLRPEITLAPGSDLEVARANHHNAHEKCFIANSVNFPVEVEPTYLDS